MLAIGLRFRVGAWVSDKVMLELGLKLGLGLLLGLGNGGFKGVAPWEKLKKEEEREIERERVHLQYTI